jgi:hypothetical protein
VDLLQSFWLHIVVANNEGQQPVLPFPFSFVSSQAKQIGNTESFPDLLQDFCMLVDPCSQIHGGEEIPFRFVFTKRICLIDMSRLAICPTQGWDHLEEKYNILMNENLVMGITLPPSPITWHCQLKMVSGKQYCN